MNSASPPRIAVVIASYNERENLRELIPAIMALPPQPRLVVVDDSSPDGTAQEVRLAAERFPQRIALIERPGKLGYGSAFVAGFRRALGDGAEMIVSMDADWSHDPAAIPKLIERLAEADAVIGSRYIDGVRILNWSMRRLLLSWCANRYINAILRFGLCDCTSGFRAYRAEALEAIDLDRAHSRGYAFLVELLEMIRRQGFRIAEAPIVYAEREKGRSKMSRGVILEAIFRPWRLLAGRLVSRGAKRANEG
ncbi:MAG: Undecaprenyl-phosphate mannosyltransferase [candidate division BRC1 bacterium ADurb.BinA364]|nr:MAG: Undecaprenyl-phosphate mannosyltransferase [candidate division BRC1 bacterium ADurb.BinA364]